MITSALRKLFVFSRPPTLGMLFSPGHAVAGDPGVRPYLACAAKSAPPLISGATAEGTLLPTHPR